MSRRPAPEKQVDKMFKIFTSAAAVLILSYPFASLPVYAEAFTVYPAAVCENVGEDVTEDMPEDEAEKTEKTENEPKVKDDESEGSVDKPEAKDDESESKDNESESTEKIKLCFIGAKYPNNNYDLRLPMGSALSAEKLSAWKAYGCDSSYEHEYIFDVLWDVDSFNESLQPDSRCYTITGTPVIPEDLYEIPDDITREPLKLNIFVTPDEGVDLRAYHADFIGRIRCIWTYVIQDMTSAQLQYKAEGDTEWSTAEAETLIGDQRTYGMADLYRMSSDDEIYNCLVIYPYRLPENAENYTFRLIYDGDRESTAITVSRSGSVRIPEVGGDRDGGDAGGGSTGGDGSGSSPDGSSSSGSHSHGSGTFESRLPAESVTSEETRIAAERLAVLLKKGSTVLFEKNGAAIEIISDVLKRQLPPEHSDQMLDVTIKRPQQDIVSISLSSGDRSIDDISGTTVRIPWEGLDKNKINENGLTAVSTDDGSARPAIYEEASGTVSFTIDTPGTYKITDSSAESVKNDTAVSEGTTSGRSGSGDPNENSRSGPAAASTAAVLCASLACVSLYGKRRYRNEKNNENYTKQ